MLRFVPLAALASAVLLAALPAALSNEFRAGDLVIEQPWARATPAGAKVGGGYLTIRNEGAAPDRLLGGSAAFAERVEVHEMSVADGVMSMRQLADGLEIPAGGSVVLAPGSYHVMFVGLGEPLVAGEQRDVVLRFETAGDVPVAFFVEPIGARAPSGHGSDHQHTPGAAHGDKGHGGMDHGDMDHGSGMDHGTPPAN